MRKSRIATGVIAVAIVAGGLLTSAPASAAAPVSAQSQMAAETCNDVMFYSSNWVYSLNNGVRPYPDNPSAQYELLVVMSRAYQGEAGYLAGEWARRVRVSCLIG
ncbi:hypothetical protein [Actinoplanes couchii]|uniref:Secreted protein n=1 Tax=Actinoplanes couchii TaxID=403638 RepID=A0ABQ3XNK9_9ACTN|nr:hypothetical protein [Actinoplanes couchii]MDR6319698.1 hypothetical protein [Actinoplanes couchii]GID60081.1 hypothetical protein Aco03nite_084850 [Actinoplanes couchii]